MMKKFILFLLIVFCFSTNFSSILAEEDYSIADASKGKIETIATFSTLYEANRFYYVNSNKYENLVLLEKDKIIKMEDGIVNLQNDSCELNMIYSSSEYGDATLNGCFASEALYLSTSSDFKKINFLISGDIGSISIDEIELIPFEMLDIVTSYLQKDGMLYHNIKNKSDSSYFAYSYQIDDALDYLKNNKIYYSFDGHYFYENFKVMASDYRNNDNTNAVNANNPYYNYYQYLPHRSYTNYMKEELENYFNNVLYFDGKLQSYKDLNLDDANDDVNLSQMAGELNAFFGYEKIYGSNAMMMLSLATHESNYGKSYSAFANNNLFAHAAYDSDILRESERYSDISESIYAHAKYDISRLYSGMRNSIYFGSYFGNILSGMNVARSLDPYWGEKAASQYYRFDSSLGYKDKNAYALGIVQDKEIIQIYKDEALASSLITLRNIKDYALIILEDLGNVYKVQLDSSYTEDYKYNPEISIGYIRKLTVDVVLNEEKIVTPEYELVTYDLNGGNINGEETLSFYAKKDGDKTAPAPSKTNCDFVDYENGIAQYKEIEKIEIESPFNNVIEEGTIYDLQGGKLKVSYKDKSSKIINIDSTMISSYVSDVSIDKLTIQYCGFSLDYQVTISGALKEAKQKLSDLIDKNIASYKEDGGYNQEEITYIKNNLNKVNYQISFDDIRTLDKMLLQTRRKDVNYTLRDSKYDISISGLGLSLRDQNESELIKPVKDTYYIEVKKIDNSAYQKIVDVASAYGFEVVDSFKVETSLNLEKTSFINPVVMSVKLKNKLANRYYIVYHLDELGNVVKCMTTQSKNYISFMTESEGNFVVLSLPSSNNYNIIDTYENISLHNSDVDMNLLFMEGIVIVSVGLLGMILIIWDSILKKKELKIWKDYKKSLLQVELPQEEKQKS